MLSENQDIAFQCNRNFTVSQLSFQEWLHLVTAWEKNGISRETLDFQLVQNEVTSAEREPG